MKRKLTFLLTALLLLTRMSLWGQSDNSSTYTSNVTLSTTGGTSATNCKVIISNVQYDGIKAGTGSVAGAWKVTVPAGTQYLHLHVAAWKNDNVTLTVTPSGLVSDIALTSNNGISSNSPFTFDGDPSTNDYYKVLSFSNLNQDTELTFTANTGKRFVVFGVNSESSGTIPTVATPTFSPVGGTYGNTQTVTISCATEGATIYYTTDNSDPVAPTGVTGTQYTQPLTISETTTVKAVAIKDGMNNSSIATASYTIQQIASITTINGIWDAAAQAGTTATPVSVTFNDWYVTGVKGGQVCISDGQYGFVIYQSGHGFVVGDKLNGTTTCNVLMYQNHYAEITGVSATNLTVTPGQEMPVLTTTIGSLELKNYGTPIDLGILTFNNSQFYDETGLSITPYNNFNLNPNPVTSLETGKQYHVKGISIIYWPNNGGQTQQVAPRSADDFEEVTAPMEAVATPTFSPAEGTYNEAQTVTIACETDGATIYYSLDGTDPTPNSTVYSDAITISETTTVKAIATKQGMNDSEIATATYTIEIVVPQDPTTYTLITNANALIPGDKYIIVGIKDGAYKALGKQNNNNRPAANVTVAENAISLIPAAAAADTLAFELTLGQDSTGYWTLYDAVNGGYLYAASSTANYLRNQSQNDANGQWTIEIADDGVATIKAQGANTHNWLRLNTSGGLFSCYGNGQLDVYLYKAGEVPAPPTPTYYAINIAQGIANGTVSTEPAQQAAEGTTVNVTATPADNYELATLTYSYTGVEAPIDIKESKQFVMPAADVTINATFVEQSGPSVITIAEARALALDEYATVQGVVTFLDGRNVYIQDATAGIDLYLNSNTVPTALAIGDMVQAHGMKTVYKGLVELSEINGADTTQFSILSNGNTLPLAEKTISEILADYGQSNMLQSTRVKIQGAVIGAINTSNNTPITQGESTINIFKIPVVEGLLEGDSVNVTAIIGCFNAAQLRVNSASDVEFTHPTLQTVATPTFSPAEGTYNEAQTVTIACETDGATIYYSLDGTDPTPNSTVYSDAITISETTTVKAIATKQGMNDSEIATATYTIEIVVPQDPTTYTLITNANALIPGDKYIIVGIKDGAYKALGKQNNNNRPAANVTVAENAISLIPAAAAADTLAFELTLGQDSTGYWTLYDAVNGGYLYAASSTANYLRNQSQNDANGQWTIEIADDGVATIKAQGANTHNWLRLNTSGGLFSCYGNGQLDVYLYKAGEVPAPPTPTYYAINIAQGIANGTVSTEPAQQAAEGTTVNVTATPADNYELATLTYSYTGVEAPIDIKESKQFVMPAADVTINATFVEQSGPSVITIAEARALALDEYATVQGVVTFLDGRNVYIQDATAGIDLYLNSNTVPTALAIGDMVQAYGKRAVFNGLVELSSINGNNADQFSILSSGNTLPLAEKTIAEILADYGQSNMLQSTRVKIQGAVIGAINTSNNTPIYQGESTMNIYKIPVVEGLLEGDSVTVTGVIGCYNAVQLRINSASDVEFTHPTLQTVATPTFSPAEGTYYEPQTVTIACETDGATIYYTIDGTVPTPNSTVYSAAITISETTTVKAIATKEGMNDSEIATATYTITDAPSSSDYVRISDLSQLGNGAQVILAARYNENVNEYYAMTAQTSGKPVGVLFTSVPSTNGDAIPSTLAEQENSFYWTVTTDGTNYTFTNAAGDVLGYTSGTNFSTGGENTAWAIEFATSAATAMVPEYSGFVISNVNNEVRAIALNSSHNFGPYHTQNIGGDGYNFFLDIFATESSSTPVCATPTFSPEGGTYYETQNVSISCSTVGATIYYTLDGSDPTPNSTVYAEPIMVSENVTIKAIAMKDGFDDSNIATAEYNIILGAVTIFNQDWEGEMNGWTFVTIEGNMPWVINQYQGNHYAYANGYGDDVANEQWCISPAFNLNIYSNASLTFRNAMKFTGPDLELYFSNDYDGENPSSATWTELTYVMSEGNYVWTESGVIDLANFTGSNCYIGFKYTSTEEEAAAWEIDDITLVGSTTEPYITATPASLTGFTHTVGNGPSTAQTFVIAGGNLPPAPGGQAGGVTISCSNSHYEFSLDGEDYYPYLGISVVGTLEPTTIYVRLNGETVGTYEGTITIEDYATATVSVSGTVTEQPIPGGDWNRIYALSDLHDGDQVIIASRYDATVGDGYYAMTAGVSGKPDGVLFTSVNNNGVEMLPADITDDADTYLWNVTMDGDVITLTNAAGDALGYSSSTNFAGNTSIEWTIAYETAGENAMIPNYTGFLISNAETSNRCIVMNANHKFGAYHTNNINNADYNFYLDLFVQGGSTTPTVATPVFSMASGTYYEEIDVEITCTTEDATIYYTTDGTDPTSASEVYTEAIHVDHDMTLKAIAMKEGLDDSGIASADYVINTDLVIILNQDWEGEMNGWNFVTVEGNKPWTIGTYAGNKYANANGYGDDVDNEQWCISPAFNIDDYANQNVTLSFMNATKFEGPALELYFSNDYDGQDPTQATWQPMSYIASEGNYTWTSSGEISLNGYSGTVCYIAFKYVSTASKSAAAWEIDDILVTADMSNAPYLTATPSALTGFVHDQNAGPSQAQTFVVRGGNLNPEPIGKILISVEETLNNGFEISLDGQEYGSSINLFPIDGFMEPTTIYVRLNGQEIGTVSGLIDIVCMDLSTSVTLEGEVLDPFAVQENIAENVRVWCHDNNNIMIENNCGSALQMVVCNILGQPVMGKHINTGSVDLSHNLSSGLYIITLYNEMGSVSTKMVVR